MRSRQRLNWIERCDRSWNANAIEQLLRRFDIDEATWHQDLTQLVDELVAHAIAQS